MRRSLVVLSLVVCPLARAQADWLVLSSGARIETKGAWVVKGRQVQFTTAKTRQLQSLPLAEIDLEASKQASGPDPNRSALDAIAQGDAVTIGVDPETRPKLEAKPLPTKIRELTKANLNPKAIEADKSLFGQGTLSTGTSISAQLYAVSYHLRELRGRAVAVAGEPRVVELEGELAGAESEVYELCLAYGADPDAGEQWYCYAIVLAAGLEMLVDSGPYVAPAPEKELATADQGATSEPPLR